MSILSLLTIGFFAISSGVSATGPTTIPLATAANYVILAETGVSTVPPSVITGSLGVSPAAASYFTGFSLTSHGTYATSTQVVGDLFAADQTSPTPSKLTTAIADMRTAYTNGAGRVNPNFLNLHTGALGSSTLAPGLYKFTTGVSAANGFTIQGSSTDTWIFQISGTLTMAANKVVTLSGGAVAENVFWVVAGAVDIGAGTQFKGVILTETAATFMTGSSLIGQIYAQSAVALQKTTVTHS